jgi:hypothetical protein
MVAATVAVVEEVVAAVQLTTVAYRPNVAEAQNGAVIGT